jgi:hypothetical protein
MLRPLIERLNHRLFHVLLNGASDRIFFKRAFGLTAFHEGIHTASLIPLQFAGDEVLARFGAHRLAFHRHA